MSSVRPLPPHPAPPLPVWGEGESEREGAGRGAGATRIQNQQQKNRIKKEERKKNNNQKARSSGADSTRKEKQKPKNQKDPFLEKKEKRKKFFALFQNFVVKLQDIGPCFQKSPNSLICFNCVLLHWTSSFFGNCSRFLMFQLCHQFANLKFFFKWSFVPNLNCLFKCYISSF